MTSLQNSQSQTLLQSSSQSPLGLQNAQSVIRTTPGGTQYEGQGETKPMLGQIGKNISSGSEGRSLYNLSGYAATSSKIANLSFAHLESKLEALSPQVSNILASQTNQRPFSPMEDGKNSGVGTPRPQDVSSLLQQEGIDGSKTVKGTPKWRCFIKSITSTHMMICFVPATYNDLMLLSYKKGNLGELVAYARQSSAEKKQSPEEEFKLNSVESGSYLEKTISVENNVSVSDKNVQRDQEKPDPSDISIDTGQGKPTSETRSEDMSASDKLVQSRQSKEESQKQQKEVVGITDSQKKDQMMDLAETNDTGQDVNNTSTMVKEEQPHDEENKENIDPERTKEETIEKETEPNGVRNCLFLPVYVYNCPLSYLTDQMVNKWTYKNPGDIFEDLHFIAEEHLESEEAMAAGDDPEVRRCNRKTLSECEKWHLGTPEKVTDDIYANQVDLKQHCTLVSETFFRSFVKSK